MKPANNQTAAYAAVFIFLSGISGTGLLTARDQGLTLLIAFFAAFFGYFWLLRSKFSIKALFIIGVIVRLILFLSEPSLSDDVYRFIWDGQLLDAGVNPYTHLPATLLDQNIPGITPALFDKLNSQPYFSVYPPFNQLFFWISTVLTNNLLLQINILRFFLLMADIGSFYLLIKLLDQYKKPVKHALWFFLNPLLILECTGNLHFEGLVIFFLLAGIYFFEYNKNLLSGISFGMAIATKLLPLIYLPAIFLKAPKGKGFDISLFAGVIAVSTFIPLLNTETINGIQSSLGLYFQKFEFNASVYFLVREIGFWVKGYNIISTLGPWLSFFSSSAILAIAVIGVWKNWSIPQTFLFTLSIYLLFTTTVHPWYILPLLAFGTLAGFYYPIVWSFFIFTTYLGYTATGFELSMGWVVLEYIAVLATFAIELRSRYASHSH